MLEGARMELRGYIEVLQRRKWILIGAVLAFVALGAALTFVQPKLYEAETLVDISNMESSSSGGTNLQDATPAQLGTEVELIKRRLLPAETMSRFGLTREKLADDSDISAVPQTNMISVKFTDPDPKKAAAVANSIAEEYLAWSRESRLQTVRTAIDEMQKRLSQMTSGTVSAPGGVTTGDSGYAAAYAMLAQRLEELRLDQSVQASSGRIAVRAEPPTIPSSPRPAANLALGLALGLLFGVAASFEVEYQDARIKSVAEVESIYEAPILGRIVEDRAKKDEGGVAVLHTPASRLAESYRMLRNALTTAAVHEGHKSLMITSAFADEGKSSVASNLAVSMAQAGAKVALVSCDFRHPTVVANFSLGEQAGLSEVLRGEYLLESVMHKVEGIDLWVIGAGAFPENPSELLASPAMRQIVEALKRSVDWVILDTPPLLAFSDASAVARWAECVVVVARDGVTTKEGSRLSMEILRNVRASVLGIVSIGQEKERTKSYSYGYGYGSYTPAGPKAPSADVAAAQAPATGGNGSKSTSAPEAQTSA
jgi:receptor protein-tyrosine kinase